MPKPSSVTCPSLSSCALRVDWSAPGAKRVWFCHAHYHLGNRRHAIESPGTLYIHRSGPSKRVYGFEVNRRGDRCDGYGKEHLLAGQESRSLRMARARGGHDFDDRGIHGHSSWETYPSEGCGGQTVFSSCRRAHTPLRSRGVTCFCDHCRMEEARNSFHTYYDDHSPWRMKTVRGCGANEGRDNRHTHQHRGARLR